MGIPVEPLYRAGVKEGMPGLRWCLKWTCWKSVGDIAGSLRGRKCIHLADVFDKPIDSPVPDHTFKVQAWSGTELILYCLDLVACSSVSVPIRITLVE